jgi:hypothetical protein
MKRFLTSVAVLALLSAPAFAQSSSSTTTETTRTVDTPTPAPVQTSTSSASSTVTHSDNGIVRTDSDTEKYVAPDGSTSTTSKVIEKQNQ